LPCISVPSVMVPSGSVRRRRSASRAILSWVGGRVQK
jgi:hypothetical protein